MNPEREVQLYEKSWTKAKTNSSLSSSMMFQVSSVSSPVLYYGEAKVTLGSKYKTNKRPVDWHSLSPVFFYIFFYIQSFWCSNARTAKAKVFCPWWLSYLGYLQRKNKSNLLICLSINNSWTNLLSKNHFDVAEFSVLLMPKISFCSIKILFYEFHASTCT